MVLKPDLISCEVQTSCKHLTKELANKNSHTLKVFSSRFLGDHSEFFPLVQRMIGSQNSAIKTQNKLLWEKEKRKKDEENFDMDPP